MLRCGLCRLNTTGSLSDTTFTNSTLLTSESDRLMKTFARVYETLSNRSFMANSEGRLLLSIQVDLFKSDNATLMLTWNFNAEGRIRLTIGSLSETDGACRNVLDEGQSYIIRQNYSNFTPLTYTV